MTGSPFLVRRLRRQVGITTLTDPLGKRILELQTSLALLSSFNATKYLQKDGIDPHGREPFVHPTTSNVEALLGNTKAYYMHHKQIARLADQYSIPSIVRWQPKNVSWTDLTIDAHANIKLARQPLPLRT